MKVLIVIAMVLGLAFIAGFIISDLFYIEGDDEDDC